MSAIVPLLAVVFGTANTLFAKILLSRYKLDYRSFLSIAFIMITAFLAPLLPWMHNFSSAMLEPMNILLILGLGVTGYLYNLFFFKGFVEEKLTEIESIVLLIPLFSSILAYITFVSERTLLPIFLGVIASGVLAWSHLNHHGFEFGKGAKYLLLAILMAAIEYLFIKELGPVYNAYTMYFTRCCIIMVLLFFTFKPKLSVLSSKHWKLLSVTQIAALTQYLLMFWSVGLNGIVMTNLILNLLPVSVYTYAYLFYHDRPGWKKILAGVITLICVIVSQMYG